MNLGLFDLIMENINTDKNGFDIMIMVMENHCMYNCIYRMLTFFYDNGIITTNTR